jgi:hypothetical protein
LRDGATEFAGDGLLSRGRGRHRDDGRIAAVTVDERMVASAAPRLLVLAFDDFPGLAHELKDV